MTTEAGIKNNPSRRRGDPFVKAILGISNVSFRVTASALEVVNSVFLHYCSKAGLDLAIVNAEKLERFAYIAQEQSRA